MFRFWWMYQEIHQHWSGKVKMTLDHYHPLNQFCVLYHIFYLFKNLNVKNLNSKKNVLVSINLYLLLLSWQHHSISSTLHHCCDNIIPSTRRGGIIWVESIVILPWRREKVAGNVMTLTLKIFNKNIKNVEHVKIWYTRLIWSN